MWSSPSTAKEKGLHCLRCNLTLHSTPRDLCGAATAADGARLLAGRVNVLGSVPSILMLLALLILPSRMPEK